MVQMSQPTEQRAHQDDEDGGYAQANAAIKLIAGITSDGGFGSGGCGFDDGVWGDLPCQDASHLMQAPHDCCCSTCMLGAGVGWLRE